MGKRWSDQQQQVALWHASCFHLSRVMVVWAVDPFEERDEFYSGVARILEMFSGYFPAGIQPVYVSTESSAWIKKNRKNLSRRVRDRIERTGLRSFKDLEVIQPSWQPSRFLGTETALALSDYAEKRQAWIVMSTHGRTGFSRMVLGSFAESLLVCSRVPVLVVGAQTQAPAMPRRIVFATVFLKSSHHVFRDLTRIAAFFSARLTVLHSVIEPADAVFGSGVTLLGGTWIPIQSTLCRDLDRQLRRCRAWIRWAMGRGVQTEELVRTGGGPVSDLILTAARERRATLIAVEERAGPLRAALVGSVTRSIIRAAPCPVLVYRNFPRAAKPEFPLVNPVPA